MNDEFKPLECNEDDVVLFGEDTTFKIGKFRRAASESFCDNNVVEKFVEQLSYRGVNLNMTKLYPDSYWSVCNNWGKDGLDCEILNLGSKSWKKGKVRIKISVEFLTQEDEPEISEPESPLDDIRRIINQDNQNQNY